MKSKIWKSIVLAVILFSVGSFLFLFREEKVDPRLLNIPFVFWTGFLVTVMLVVFTFLASRFFPHEEPKKV